MLMKVGVYDVPPKIPLTPRLVHGKHGVDTQWCLYDPRYQAILTASNADLDLQQSAYWAGGGLKRFISPSADGPACMEGYCEMHNSHRQKADELASGDTCVNCSY